MNGAHEGVFAFGEVINSLISLSTEMELVDNMNRISSDTCFASPWVLAPFFLRSLLRYGEPGPTLEKMGPALIACACASFYPKSLVKDLEWPSKPPEMLVSVVIFFPGMCRLSRILNAIAFKLSTPGVFAAIFIYCFKILKWFSITPARRPATTAQGTMLHFWWRVILIPKNKQAKCNSSESCKHN